MHIWKDQQVADSISFKMASIFASSYLAKCYSVFFYTGYTPEDSLGAQYIYHAVEACGLMVSSMLCFILRRRRAYFVESQEHDTFTVWPIILACAVLSFVTKSNANDSAIGDFAWMFSQWLETGAIVPQIWLVARKGGLEKASSHFIALLILNRLLLSVFWGYVQYLDWVHSRMLTNYFMWGVWGNNVSHLLLCADYLYYYFKSLSKTTFAIPI